MHPVIHAAEAPDKPAIIMARTGETITYRELEDRSNQGAQLFRRLGLKTGDGIAIFMENNARYLDICWAAQRAGLYFTCISSRLTAASEATTLVVREKIPFIQDAMVRDVNGADVTTAEDREQVDIPKLEARLMGDARKVLGAGKVKQITICTVQIAELHPVQTQAQVAPKDQKPVDAHKNPVKSRCES